MTRTNLASHAVVFRGLVLPPPSALKTTAWEASTNPVTTSFCKNGPVSTTSPKNVDALVFLKSQKGLGIIIENNWRQVRRSQRVK